MLFTFAKIILLSCLIPFFQPSPLPTFEPNDIVKIVVTQNTTDGDLELMKSNLKYRNISFEYANLRNKKNEMEHILFIVNCNDGYNGSFSLVFDKKHKNDKVGFVRNYTKQGSAFAIGNMTPYEDYQAMR
jgi:hypothetical protein